MREGVKEAKDERALVDLLKSGGLVLTSIKSQKSSFKINGLFKYVSLTKKVFFTRHLEVMIRSGVPLMAALGILSEQSKSQYFKKVINDVKTSVEKGSSLSESMKKYNHIFGDLYVNMIEVGEVSGNLEQALKLLRIQMQKEHDLLAKIKGALLYPIVIMTIMIGVGIIMLFYVMPKLFAVFEDMNVELPFLTKIIIDVSTFAIVKWWLLLTILVLMIFGFLLGMRAQKFRSFLNSALFRFPLIGKLMKKTNIARINRTLNSLLESGVSIVNAIKTTSKTINNVQYVESLKHMGKEVEKGVPLSKTIEDYKNLFPLLVVQMIRVGEETGNLAQLLGEIADFYEAEVDEASKNLSTIIEPFLMVFIGTAIGFFAVAMIQPMYSIMNAL